MTEKTAAEILRQPIQYVPGVGPRRAEILTRLNLRTVADVLFFFPRAYEDPGDVRPISDLQEDAVQSVIGEIREVEARSSAAGRFVLGVLVSDGPSFLRALWFDQPYRQDLFRRGQRVMLTGRARYKGMMWVMAHPKVHILAEGETPRTAPLPIYPLTEGIRQWEMRRIVRRVVENYADHLEDVFPDDYREQHGLLPLPEAARRIHFPPDLATAERARRRFVYQELCILQLALAIRRARLMESGTAPSLSRTAKIDARIRRLLPFSLTPSQERAIEEITADMARSVPMNRLLQGDVGSGKTVVAVYAVLVAVAHQHQAALMAPTEILARQHFQTVDRLLARSRVRRALLVGGLSPAERASTLERLTAGDLDLVVGTQAVVQEGVRFHRLGLVVIDEQHKFGVRQRAALKGAGKEPHYLVMTATPIPRTLTMTLFGDLDVSVIRELPPGRKPVKTYLASPEQRPQWWDFFRRKLRQGRQGYVVVPLVEEGDSPGLRSVEAAYRELQEGELREFRLAAVHGRMTAEEKDSVMHRFRRREIDVLICTSVVEVGVDVPNATLMTIENAERFGLAQLHQLRGRVARGKFVGHCCAFTDAASEESRRRLEAFRDTTDGFALAEIDFAIRGPGEIFGTRQHGLPPFRIADLVRDSTIAEEARRDAWQVVQSDPGLRRPEHARLRAMVLKRYGKTFDLGDVG